MFRVCAVTVLITILIGIFVFVGYRRAKAVPNSCSNTDYGQGVTCVGGAGAGGPFANVTSKTVAYAPTAGHSILAAAYTCADGNCQNIPATTLKISDDINDPEACFAASPHSPFTLKETSAGTENLQEYIWVCSDVPSGVTSFTATCSKARSCSYITLTITEWKGLARTNVFDVDGGAASSQQDTTASIPTWGPTTYTNELLYTFLDNTGDETMTPGSPYRTALQFWPGNINTAVVMESAGPQIATTHWDKKDDWYGAIAAIKTAASQPAK